MHVDADRRRPRVHAKPHDSTRLRTKLHRASATSPRSTGAQGFHRASQGFLYLAADYGEVRTGQVNADRRRSRVLATLHDNTGFLYLAAEYRGLRTWQVDAETSGVTWAS